MAAGSKYLNKDKYMRILFGYAYMSRPKPKVLLEYTNKKTYKAEQVLEAEAIWAVFYKNEPFNLKSFNSLTSYPGPKYKKTSFSNPGHALNLAKKLNLTFGTEEFQVVKLTQGAVVK
jgi:hypothetical protein